MTTPTSSSITRIGGPIKNTLWPHLPPWIVVSDPTPPGIPILVLFDEQFEAEQFAARLRSGAIIIAHVLP